MLYGDVDTDSKGIQAYRATLAFPEVAERFHLIGSSTVPVVVPYQDGGARMEEWLETPSRRTWQRLQLYIVSLWPYEATKLQQEGWMETVSEGLWVWTGSYDGTRGIVQAKRDPADLIWS